jgi:hypothetical protein
MRYALVLIAACGGVPNSPQTSCQAIPPIGDPSQFTMRTLPGFRIADPLMCHGTDAYIRIERLAGSRELGIARIQGGGFGEGCTDPAKFATCAKLNVGAVLSLVQANLAAEHVEAWGNGAGPCARDLSAGYDGWNFAIGVHDWKDLDRLVVKMTEVFDRYDIKGYVGVAVYSIVCASAA